MTATDELPAAHERQDVAWRRASPGIPDDVPIRGFAYGQRTGTVREVSLEETAAA